MRRRAAVTGLAAKALPAVLQDMRLLWAVVHGVQAQSKRMRTSLGVTGPQRLVIRVLGLSPGISAGELATTLHLHPSTMTGVLGRLVSLGLITRVPSEHDRRRSVLRLTASGARVNRRLQGTVEAAVSRGLEGLTVEERESWRRALAAIVRQLSPSER